MAKGWICGECYSVDGVKKHTAPWAWAVGLVCMFGPAVLGVFAGVEKIMLPALGVLGLFVAIAVAVAGSEKRCAACEGKSLIPVDTPRGKKLIAEAVAQIASPPHG